MKLYSIFLFLSVIILSCDKYKSSDDVPPKKETIQTDLVNKIDEKQSQSSSEYWTESKIGNTKIKQLLHTGFSIEPHNYKIHFETYRIFKSDSILVNVKATINKTGHGRIDSLSYFWQNIEYTFGNKFFNIEINSEKELESIQKNQRSLFQLKDYNFDGIPDLSFKNKEYSGVKNLVEDIFIYNPSIKSFIKNIILSKDANLSVDSKSKTINSFWQGGMASQIYGSTIYTWKNDKLIVLEKVFQDYDSNNEIFIKTRKYLVDDTLKVVEIDTIPFDEI